MLQLILALTRVCSHLREQEVFTTNSSSWVQPLPRPVGGLTEFLSVTCFPRAPCGELCEREGEPLWLRPGLVGPQPRLEVPCVSHAGMSRLIELCRSPSERNSSDAVLVACLVSSQSSP